MFLPETTELGLKQLNKCLRDLAIKLVTRPCEEESPRGVLYPRHRVHRSCSGLFFGDGGEEASRGRSALGFVKNPQQLSALGCNSAFTWFNQK